LKHQLKLPNIAKRITSNKKNTLINKTSTENSNKNLLLLLLEQIYCNI
jgi:hypothetical protein